MKKVRRGRKNNKQNNEISIYYNNINGMRSKKKSLGIIVKNIKPDVVCLCETKLGSLRTVKNKMEGYRVIGRCVKYGQGGVLIAAKKNAFSTFLDRQQGTVILLRPG